MKTTKTSAFQELTMWGSVTITFQGQAVDQSPIYSDTLYNLRGTIYADLNVKGAL